MQYICKLNKNIFRFSQLLKRANFKELSAEDYNYFSTVLPKLNILTDD
jgi:hypothetical protein